MAKEIKTVRLEYVFSIGRIRYYNISYHDEIFSSCQVIYVVIHYFFYLKGL